MSSSWKILIAFLSGLLLGGAAVGFGLHYYMKHKVTSASNPDRILDRLSSQLALTPGQRDKVSTLLKKEAPKMETLRKSMEEKSHKLWVRFEADLRPILNEEQRKKLDQMEKRWREHKGWQVGMSGMATYKESNDKAGPK